MPAPPADDPDSPPRRSATPGPGPRRSATPEPGSDPVDQLDERLRALAHPIRRQLLAACLEQERRAGELVALTGQPDATISEHLKVLRKCGLVEMTKDGRLRLYRTAPRVVEAVRGSLRELSALGAPGDERAGA